jgi:hypothetical protein
MSQELPPRAKPHVAYSVPCHPFVRGLLLRRTYTLKEILRQSEFADISVVKLFVQENKNLYMLKTFKSRSLPRVSGYSSGLFPLAIARAGESPKALILY